MSEWPQAPLDEFVPSDRPICYGVLKPGDPDPDGIPLVRIVDMDGDEVHPRGLFQIAPSLDQAFARSRLRGDEVLLSIQGTVGRVALASDALCGANISRTVARIALDRDRYDSSFLRHWLRSAQGQSRLTDALVGTTRSSLNIGDLRRVQVPTPPVGDQRRVAEVLDTIDETIRATEGLIEKTEKVLTGIGSDLLSDGAPTPIRDLISDEWPGEWGEESPAEGLARVHVLRATNINGHRLNYDTAAERYVPAAKARDKQLRAGDILLEGAGGGPGVPVGRVSRFDQGSNEGVSYLTSNFFRALRPAMGVRADYLYWLLDYEYRKPSIWACQQQTTGIINLNLRDYLDRRVSFNADRQELIARTLDDTLNVLDRLQDELQGLRRLRSGVADDLLSGRVRTMPA